VSDDPAAAVEQVAEHGTTVTKVTKTFGASVVGERGQQVRQPTSTEEEDRVSAGQRTVNLIWETTQQKIALSVIWSSLFVAIVMVVLGSVLGIPKELIIAAAVFLFGVANLVTGFYFGRTNHQKIGGVEQGR